MTTPPIRWHEVDFRREQAWKFIPHDAPEQVLCYSCVAVPRDNKDERLLMRTPWQPYPDGSHKFDENLWLPLEKEMYKALCARILDLES